jgi:hypothetical protein
MVDPASIAGWPAYRVSSRRQVRALDDGVRDGRRLSAGEHPDPRGTRHDADFARELRIEDDAWSARIDGEVRIEAVDRYRNERRAQIRSLLQPYANCSDARNARFEYRCAMRQSASKSVGFDATSASYAVRARAKSPETNAAAAVI